MKLSRRETLIILGLILIIFVAVYGLLILAPAINRLNDNKTSYKNLQNTYVSNQTIIEKNTALELSRTDIKADIAVEEVRLLPMLKSEVISADLSKIFEDAGLPCITALSCGTPVWEQVPLPNGTPSENAVQWVSVKIKLSGTDGVTPDGSEGGPKKVGYEEFMAAVHIIQDLYPDSIRISSIGMEETNQGFQFFTITVDVYAFSIPERETPIDTSLPYIVWERPDVTTGGLYGIPIGSVPASVLDATYFRPFATGPVGFANANGTTPP